MLLSVAMSKSCLCFFLNDTATTEIYTLSLHDALPISVCREAFGGADATVRAGTDPPPTRRPNRRRTRWIDRKSTRLNSSHMSISYAVFCLKKKNNDAMDKAGKGLLEGTLQAGTSAVSE